MLDKYYKYILGQDGRVCQIIKESGLIFGPIGEEAPKQPRHIIVLESEHGKDKPMSDFSKYTDYKTVLTVNALIWCNGKVLLLKRADNKKVDPGLYRKFQENPDGTSGMN